MPRFFGDDFPTPPQPFIQRHQFRATLSFKGQSLPDIEVLIDRDDLGRTDPKGHLLGNNDTFKAIEILDDRRYMPHGVALAGDEIEATIDIVSLRSRGYGSGPTGLVGDFICRDVRLTFDLGERSSSSRTITFFLAGPPAHWQISYMPEVSYDGTASMKFHHDDTLKPDLPLPFTVRLRPHFFYAHSDHSAVAHVQAIEIKTEQPREELSDDDFLRAATEFVDDCCLLVSLVAGSWSTWYGYAFEAGDRLVQTTRQIRRGPEVDDQDTPVGRWDGRKFLAQAVPALRALRASGKDPRLAMLHAISAREARSLEEEFIRYFFALESLKELHADALDADRVVPENQFRKVRHAVEAGLQALAADPAAPFTQDHLAAFRRKLPELNRPAFAEILDRLLAHYALEWRDLYPPDANLPRPAFVGVRDQLVHTGLSDPKTLELEIIRLQGLVERILLRMLGWEDLHNAPRSRFRLLLHTTLAG